METAEEFVERASGDKRSCKVCRDPVLAAAYADLVRAAQKAGVSLGAQRVADFLSQRTPVSYSTARKHVLHVRAGVESM